VPVWRDDNGGSRGATGTLVSGLVLAGIGLVLLLDRFGIVHSDVLWHLWPMIFAIVGIVRLVESQRTSDQMLGAFLVSIGGLLTLHEFGYIHFGIGELWPLFLIAGGLLLAWHSNEIGQGRKGFSVPSGFNSSGFQTIAVFGGIERKIEGKYFQGGTVTAFFGGFKIDLTRAEMEGDEAVIHVNAVFGGGEIIAPESWRVSVEGAGIFGGYVDKTRYVPRPDLPAKTLHVRGAAVFGGIEVKSW
jgi:predicted membrane protein